MENVFFLSQLVKGEFFRGKSTRSTQDALLQSVIAANRRAALVGSGGSGLRMSYHKPIGSVVGYVVTGYYEKGKLIRAQIGFLGTVLGQIMPDVQRQKVLAVKARAERKPSAFKKGVK